MTEPRRDLHPTEGARYLLELVAANGDESARYRATIYAPDAAYRYAAELRRCGDATLTADGAPAPAELEAGLLMLAKLTARSSEAKAGEGLPPWAARVLRWRGPGRGK